MEKPKTPITFTNAELRAYRRARVGGDLSMPDGIPVNTNEEDLVGLENAEEEEVSEKALNSESASSRPENNLPLIREALGGAAFTDVDLPRGEPKDPDVVEPSSRGSIFGNKVSTIEAPQSEQKQPAAAPETATRVPVTQYELEARPQDTTPDLKERPKTVPQELTNRRGSAPESVTDRIVKDEAQVAPLEAPVLTVVDGGKSVPYMTNNQWAEFTEKYNESINKMEEKPPISPHGPLLFEPPASGISGSAS